MTDDTTKLLEEARALPAVWRTACEEWNPKCVGCIVTELSSTVERLTAERDRYRDRLEHGCAYASECSRCAVWQAEAMDTAKEKS